MSISFRMQIQGGSSHPYRVPRLFRHATIRSRLPGCSVSSSGHHSFVELFAVAPSKKNELVRKKKTFEKPKKTLFYTTFVHPISSSPVICFLVELPTPTGGGSPLAATNSSGYGEGPIARQATRKQITGELDIEPQKVV